MEEKKSDFQAKLNAQVDELEAKLDNLKLKAKDATAEAKVKYNDLIDDIEPKIAEGKAKLKELADTADDAWDDVKEGAASIWEQMKSTFKNVKDRFDGDDDDDDDIVAEEPKAE